jgi:hypothetical protein
MAKLIFFKGEYGTFWDNFICFVTNSKYSHVEYMLDSGKCWSSSNRDGGVRFTYIDTSSGHWDELKCPSVSDCLFLQEKGKKYDYLGLIGTIIKSPIFSRQRKWFCSEIVAEAMGLQHSWKYTPQMLYEKYSNASNI